MKQTINFYQFRQAFKDMGREKQFSYEALEAIFEYMEDYERDSGEEIELDVIAICCEWTEASPKDIIEDYGIETDLEDEEELKEEIFYWLEDRTQAVALDNGNIVYVNF